MEKFRRNHSGDTFIRFNSTYSITKVIVRQYDNYKQFVFDTNEISEKQLETIKLNYPVITNEINYLKHLEKLKSCISDECKLLIPQTQTV